MKLYEYISGATNYIHYFTVSNVRDRHAIVDKSYFKMAEGNNAYLQGKGDNLYIGTQKGYHPDDVRHFLIELVFINIGADFTKAEIIINKL